ncbi:hypothetical protein JCM8208_000067 [Rhodotorula glutinis]
MLASLAGGASCGPSNPLQQLSKTYGADRGAQQDHFNPQAGSSGSAFRQSTPTQQPLPNDPAAAHFFQQQQQPQQDRPFDLSPLHRALTPAQQPRQPQQVPAWAQAFAAQQPAQHQQQPANAHEPDAFARAFNRPTEQQHQPQQNHWRADFHQHQAPSTAIQQHQQPQQAAPSAISRLHGQGFSGVAPMMGMARPMAYAPGPQEAGPMLGRPQQEQQGKMDWETAFLAQEASRSTTDDASTAASTRYDGIAETRPLTPPLRAHSPIADPVARDALAETAANLLSTVKSAEAQRIRAEDGADISDKFAASSFMSLMRQLRDGEVAVEGDKLVEQPAGGATTKSQAQVRDDGWASSFAATTSVPWEVEREEEGRVGGPAPPILRPGEPVAQHAHEQHAWAERQAGNAQLVRELEEGYQTLEGMWDDEDRVRAEREGRTRDKGKGRAFQFQGDGGTLAASDEGDEAFVRADTHVPLAQSSWEEDFDDPSMIVGGHALGGGRAATPRTRTLNAQQQEWDALQNAWDEFDVSAAGLKPRSQDEAMSAVGHGYAFAQHNPYVHAPAATTHHHAQHHAAVNDLSSALNERHESLLQQEADVQRDPTNAGAWLSLGLKQQQNEREELAIAALKRALELDPLVAGGAAHLALAVSFTNEGRRGEAYAEINRWVDSIATEGGASYANEIEQYRGLFGAALPDSMTDRHTYLSNLLIRLAQSRAEQSGAADVDADVQVGLGVLFNASEDYEKASDCFGAALSVRPDDPLLFNRLGATLANSGKTDLAMQYYLAAIDIDPGYVRARFNLAVANMNTGQYEDAVHHLLTALSVQEADSELDSLQQAPVNAAGVSHALWDSLQVSLLHMQRSDLSPLAASRDLRGLLQAFAADR